MLEEYIESIEMRVFPFLAAALVLAADCESSQITSRGVATESASEPTSKVVLISEVEWQQLNPKRGDKSPKAATLWGDRDGPGASGFLLKPVDGFSSPPHVHTAHFHGVVIGGTIHNAEPSAEETYLPSGSFWTQPDGGVHITACRGSCLAYIEIEGEYDVLAVENARNNIAEATSRCSSNITWADPPGMSASANGPKVAVLSGNRQDDQQSGTLIKLPAGFAGIIRSHGATLRAVAIQGLHKYRGPGKNDVKNVEPGSYSSSKGRSMHQVSSEAGGGCGLYVRSTERFDVFPARPHE